MALRETSAPMRCNGKARRPRGSCDGVPGRSRVRPRAGRRPVINVRATQFDSSAADIDLVIDTVGGETQCRSFAVLKRGGVLVSSVAAPDQDMAGRHGVRAMFVLVNVTIEGLNVSVR